MPNSWRIIEGQLRRAATAESSTTSAFAELAARRAPTIAPFADAMAVVAHLHAIDGSDEERDLLLAELVEASKHRDAPGRLASTLVWLTLWPGLTAIMRRAVSRRRAFADAAADDLAADLLEKLTLAISRFDNGRASKTAATLLLNTRRLFWASLEERDAWLAFTVPIRRDDYSRHAALAPHHDEIVATVLDLRRGALPDAELVIATVVEGESAREAATRCGVAEETIKKRIQRALLRCRVRETKRRRSRVPFRRPKAPIGVKGKQTKPTEDTAGSEMRPTTPASTEAPSLCATEPQPSSQAHNERGA